MKNNTQILRKKQRGFALIEVLLAALIMTVGGAAFMKLQRVGLQYNYNNYARTQGVVIAQGFVEQLRSNITYVKENLINDKITSKVSDYKPTTTINCSIAADCAENIFKHQKYLISQQIAEVSPNSVLCYIENPDETEGHIRVTYLWQDNSKEGKTTKITTCPKFADTTTLTNSVTIYAQL